MMMAQLKALPHTSKQPLEELTHIWTRKSHPAPWLWTWRLITDEGKEERHNLFSDGRL